MSKAPPRCSKNPSGKDEAIAIIGMACRLPGGANSPSQLWDLLMEKRIGNSPKVPASRFNIDTYLHENPERPGSFHVPGGYFIDDDLEKFDPSMFNISPVEASWMDPQQRKLLEVVYEAIENSGASLESTSDRIVGCFVGSFTNDFQHMVTKEPDFRHQSAATGGDVGTISSRVSHVFNLRGPSVLLNNACSSTLYALDAASTAIRRGQCEGAIVGGTNLILDVDQQMNTAKIGVLSPTSTCHTFDASADGYGRADGVGALYVKSLSAALRDGDPIRAVIRSTAVNANGRHSDNGMTFPSVQGQRDVITAAYRMADLSPSETTYIECHGTGTAIGDPIEIEAISQAMRSAQSSKPLLVGAVKPNIGHSEAASSIFTIMKAVKAIENGLIPPTAGIANLNPKIKWDDWNVKAVTEPTKFPEYSPVRRVGVSAFGYGGSNAHAILENVEYLLPTYSGHQKLSGKHGPATNVRNKNAGNPALLVFSAHNKPTLRQNVRAHANLQVYPELLDLSHTLGSRRTVFNNRTFAVCYQDSLGADLTSACDSAVWETGKVQKVAFVFTGQGAQWAQMGLRLITCYPSFRQSFQKLDKVLSSLPNPPEWSLEDIIHLTEAESPVDQPIFAQTLCTALQIALVDLLRKWGVEPAAVVGHSSGEIAAAYAAGLVTRAEAITIAFYRGRAVSERASPGAMLAVGLSSAEVQDQIRSYSERVVVACVNSPTNVTLSGDLGIIQDLKRSFDDQGTFARVLKTAGNAYHSPRMIPVGETYCAYLSSLEEDFTGTPVHTKAAMFSTVTASRVTEDGLGPEYWVKNLTQPVLFAGAVDQMLEETDNLGCVMELGPHSALASPVRQILSDRRAPPEYIPSLRRNDDDSVQLLKAVGTLWAKNILVDLVSINSIERLNSNGQIEEERGQLVVDLPPYQWHYPKKLLYEPRASQEHRFERFPRHDILGRKVLGLSENEPVWRNVLRHKDLAWLKDHSLGNDAIFPAAGYLAMAIEAMRQVHSAVDEDFDPACFTMRDVSIFMALVIPQNEEGVETIFKLVSTHGQNPLNAVQGVRRWYSFSVTSLSNSTWREHVRGRCTIDNGRKARKHRQLPALGSCMSYQAWCGYLRKFGFDYGPSFLNSAVLHFDNNLDAVTADIKIKQDSGVVQDESRYIIHPASLDGCLQLTVAAIHRGQLDRVSAGTVLTHFEEISIWNPSSEQLDGDGSMAHAWVVKAGSRSFEVDAQMIAPDGNLIAKFSKISCLYYEAAIPTSLPEGSLYMSSEWLPDVSFQGHAPGLLAKEALTTLASWALHKQGKLSALSLDAAATEAVRHALPLANINNSTLGQPLDGDDRGETVYNLLILPATMGLSELCTMLVKIQRNLSPECTIIWQRIETGAQLNPLHLAESIQSRLNVANFNMQDIVLYILNGQDGVCEMLRGPFVRAVNDNSQHHITVVYKSSLPALLPLLVERLGSHGLRVRVSTLRDLELVANEQIVMLTDSDRPILADLHQEELEFLQRLVESSQPIFWITFGDLLEGAKPEHAMVSGWARVVRNESASLKIILMDLDGTPASDAACARLITEVVGRMHTGPETEYIIKNGVVHIGRIVPMDGNDFLYNEHKGHSDRNDRSVRGSTLSGRITFRSDPEKDVTIDVDDVEIRVSYIGLNLEDSLAINGSLTSDMFNQEISGTVMKVGSNVMSLSVGNEVAGLSFNTLSPIQQTAADLVRVVPSADLKTMSTMSVAFVTALYGLKELAALSSDDTVLIMNGSGSAGHAALQLCKLAGVNVCVVVPSKSEASSLESINPSAQFILGNDDVPSQLQRLTDSTGLDIIFAPIAVNVSLTEECCRFLSKHGKIVLFGDRPNNTDRELDVLKLRDCSLFSFSLHSLLLGRKKKVVERLLDETWELLKKREIYCSWEILECTNAEIDAVLQTFSTSMNAPRPVLAYTDESAIDVISRRQRISLEPDATYLLVGGLGGLGRSLASWMVERGARRLAFMSRSGSISPDAANLVQSLQGRNVEVTILRADVTSKKAVTYALSTLDPNFPVRGIVNAAADAFFHNISIEAWRAAATPKVKGSLNLHECFSTVGELDFFLLTGSVTGTAGSTGQSNYGAGNAYLDALARHRRTLGLPAVSLILPMVLDIGYVANRPEIESSLRRKGLYGIEEQEFLRAFEDALLLERHRGQTSYQTDHLIVGLQPSRLNSAMGSHGANIESLDWLNKAPFRRLVSALNESSSGTGQSSQSRGGIRMSIKAAKSSVAAIEIAKTHLTDRLSGLLMLDQEDVLQGAGSRSVASFGIDSMIGAEFRNWIFREFGVEIVFQTLLAGDLTVDGLASLVCGMIRKEEQ